MIQINEFFDREQAGRIQTYFEDLLVALGCSYDLRLNVSRSVHTSLVLVVQVSGPGAGVYHTVYIPEMLGHLHGSYRYLCDTIQRCVLGVLARIESLDAADDLIVIHHT